MVEPPLWKICWSNRIISPNRDQNKEFLKPPPSGSITGLKETKNLQSENRLVFLLMIFNVEALLLTTLRKKTNIPLKKVAGKIMFLFPTLGPVSSKGGTFLIYKIGISGHFPGHWIARFIWREGHFWSCFLCCHPKVTPVRGNPDGFPVSFRLEVLQGLMGCD